MRDRARIPPRAHHRPPFGAARLRETGGRREPRKEAAAIWKSFQRAVARIRLDGQWGEVIPRIPAYFARTYGVPNLYCVDLPFFHRAFYTIFHRDVVFLDLVDHDQYDTWFPGRRR